jgi:hypothetical protein
MSDPVDNLVLDLLEWIGPRPRPYAEVIEAWRTSCPRLPVWEEANVRGHIVHEHVDGTGTLVSVSPAGLALLARSRHAGVSVSSDADASLGGGGISISRT